MNVLLANADDGSGGAARAALRLHSGLLGLDVKARLLVQKKTTDLCSVVGPEPFLGFWLGEIRPHLDALPTCLYPHRSGELFSPSILPGRFRQRAIACCPDVVHLHWVCNGFVSIEALRHLNRPIVWTLHDSWAFTGGCHLPGECQKYRSNCGACPVLGSDRENDLSRRVWRRKQKVLKGLPLTVVTPSRWLAEQARSSALLADKPTEVIPNGLDCQVFRPHDKEHARDVLGLPQAKQLVLFTGVNATTDANKGYDLLVEALKFCALEERAGAMELVVMGASGPVPGSPLGMNAHYLGHLQDEATISLAYAASDVLVMPSRQENLPYTVMEAMACGLPCVAFDVGGVADLVGHQVNGFLAQPYDAEGLSAGIRWVLEDRARGLELSRAAREKVVSTYDLKSVARQYRELYQRIVD